MNMKYGIILTVILFSSHLAFSQSLSNIGMQQEFAGIVKGSLNAFQTFSSNDVIGSQFFFPDWKSGEVVSTNKEVFNSGLQFVYDKVRQELFIRKKDSALILLGIKDQIQSFSLHDDGKEYNFVNSSLFTKEKPEIFYQALVYDSLKLSFLKYIKTTFVKADPTDMMKQKEGNVYDSYEDKFTYYIVKGKGTPQPVQLKSKSLKKTFADLNINTDKYLNDHPEKIDEEYLFNMINELNK